MKMVLTTWIDAPVDRVYAAFADLEHLPGRVTGIKKIELLTPGPVAVGTRFKETRVMFGGEATQELTVTTLDPGKAIILSLNSGGVAYRATHTFTPENDGTRVTLEMEGRTMTFFAWLMQPLGWLMQGTMRKTIQKDLDEMKLACEAEMRAA